MLKELLESKITQIKIILDNEYHYVEDCAENAIGDIENAIESFVSYEILPYSDFDNEIIFEIVRGNLDLTKYRSIFKQIENKYDCIYMITFLNKG